MFRTFIICCLLASSAGPHHLFAQASSPATPHYTISVPVDEVDLTFHAADTQGLPVNDLTLNELTLYDNGQRQSRILDFRLLQDFPIRAAILLDTSESMADLLPASRAIAVQYAQHLLRQKSDQALVMDFGYSSKVTQSWTSDPSALAFGVRIATAGSQNPLGGTAIIDTVFRACLYEFGEVNHSASGNFILLFTDGEDNASRTSLAEAVNACQHSNTAIYAFHAEPTLGSSGPSRLAALASQTGGRVFREDRSQTEIADDLKTIEADLRNEYRLIYKPADLKHDGSFHSINLITPARVDRLTIRSGYYASNH